HQRVLPSVLRYRPHVFSDYSRHRHLQRGALARTRAPGRRPRRVATGPHPAAGPVGARVRSLLWGLRSLGRQPLRTGLSLAGIAVSGRVPDSLVTLFGYGIDPTAQGLYRLSSGHDLTPDDSTGVLLSEIAAVRLGAGLGDTVTLVGRLDPQVVTASVGRRLVVRGLVRWLYDYRGQPSVGTVLPLMQRLARQDADDRVSLLVVKVRDDAAVPRVAARLRERFPQLEVNSVADLVVQFKRRLVYF